MITRRHGQFPNAVGVIGVRTALLQANGNGAKQAKGNGDKQRIKSVENPILEKV